jgi:hypothetical protein
LASNLFSFTLVDMDIYEIVGTALLVGTALWFLVDWLRGEV